MPGDDKPQYVVMATDRKLPQFTGLPSKPGDLNVDEFILECKRSFKVWGTPKDQQGFLVGRACVGEAKAQVQLLNDANKDDVDIVFVHLREAYADKAPFSALIQAFYARQQLPGESIRQYSLALQTVMRRASDKDVDNKQLPNPDLTLRDKFIAGLRDQALRKDLLKLMREKNDSKFKDVREEALHLSGEYDEEIRSEPTMRVAMQTAERHSSPDSSSLCAQVAQLTVELAAIKGHMSQQGAASQQGAPFRSSYRPRGLPGDKWTPDGRPICRRCGGPGHMARACFSDYNQGNTYSNPRPAPYTGSQGN
ncbi:uncharacterized protein [Branchiostoma lanceolatum]|uniref:uncharacterized protein n=1 Tax=Branchiostoma lanceolatum TaxID=7740 RepID=UPI003452E51B